MGIGFSGVFDGILLGFYEILIKLKGITSKHLVWRANAPGILTTARDSIGFYAPSNKLIWNNGKSRKYQIITIISLRLIIMLITGYFPWS